MDSGRSDNTVILLRAAPGSAAAERAGDLARQLVAAGNPAVVFFHGPAVSLAVSPQAGQWRELAASGTIELWVCEAAWQRRHQQALPDGFKSSTLVRFWQRALGADQVLGFGGDDD
jgi:sulfur relay (sulfurtransferase) complex TusBCD TusD component (DsrE family)